MASGDGSGRLSDEFLAREAERTIMDYSWAWEGEREHVEDLGGAVLRWLDVPWFGLDGMVVHLNCDPARVDAQLDDIIARVEENGRKCWWVVGPSAQPPDVADRLVAHGFVKDVEWAGLALRDLSTPIPINPDLVVEPLSPANAEEYAALCVEADPTDDPRVPVERLAAAHRFIETNAPDTGIYLGRLDGKLAACVVSHIEPTGVVYLRNAVTLPQFRRRGVYLSLVAHRIALAREAGCTAAVVQAQTRSSAPILLKRGFERVTTVWGLARPGTETTT
jgi:GNAT superfamily N-acetyltransferase